MWRYCLHIGRIIELLPGRDGQVRSAIVRTMDKSKKPVNLIRACTEPYSN